MKDRIIELRKSLKLSQAAFAEKIGVSRNFIGLVECGDRNISERTIKDICSVYNVNEDWLMNGTGEMFKKRTRNQEILAFANKAMESSDDAFVRRFATAIARLSEDDWESIEKIVDKLISDIKK